MNNITEEIPRRSKQVCVSSDWFTGKCSISSLRTSASVSWPFSDEMDLSQAPVTISLGNLSTPIFFELKPQAPDHIIASHISVFVSWISC